MHYKSSPEPDNKRSILNNVAGTISDANPIYIDSYEAYYLFMVL